MYIPYSCHNVSNDDVQAVIKTLQSDWITTGPLVDEFEQAVSSFCEYDYGVAVSSGTAALHAAMFSIGVKPGDEVIVPAITFVATANAVVFQGATPIFCDVLKDSLLIDSNKVENLITDSTKAIVAVDYAGHPCDYSKLREIADKYSLPFIVDACHSLGSTYCCNKVSQYADLAVFSFHPVKSITTGEGGMLVTNDPKICEKSKSFRNHGITKDYKSRSGWDYEMTELGYNYRITDFQCALGMSQLSKLPEWVIRRNHIADYYNENLCAQIRPLSVDSNVVHAYHLYVIRSNNRDKLFTSLRKVDIGVNVHYMPVYLHPFYRDNFGTSEGLCPVAEDVYPTILSIPIFPAMSDFEVEKVTDEVNKLAQ